MVVRDVSGPCTPRGSSKREVYMQVFCARVGHSEYCVYFE